MSFIKNFQKKQFIKKKLIKIVHARLGHIEYFPVQQIYRKLLDNKDCFV